MLNTEDTASATLRFFQQRRRYRHKECAEAERQERHVLEGDRLCGLGSAQRGQALVADVCPFVRDGDPRGGFIGKMSFIGKAILDDDVECESKGASERKQIAPSDPG